MCNITDRLTAMSKAPKPWLATWNMPNGDTRQFRALSDVAGNSWLTRNIDNHGGTGFVERVA